MGLKARIARLNAQAVKIVLADQPLVVQCRPSGDDEHRAPGIYYDGNGRCPTIVFEVNDNEHDPPEELLARFRPKTGPRPLFIIEGPCVVRPPLNDPEPYPSEGAE